LTATRNSLATWEDSSLIWGYDHHVGIETTKIQGRTSSEIHSILRVAASEGSVASIYRVQACLNYLLKELQEQPSIRLYSALILAQCRADGSVMEVERLLKEMSEEGFEMDNGVCHDVLKVLSVHPDYLLRTEVLNHMRAKWYQLSDGGWHDVVAGLIREGSLEIAMDRMEEMQRTGIRILPWLYDLIIYALAEREEMDAVLRLLEQRVAQGDMNISGTLWYYLLDVSGRALHYDLASYVWNSRVRPHYLNPSSGICLNVMTVAARERDTELAQDVFDFLARRETVFEAQHYELLIEAYVNAGIPENGFYILSAMQQAGVIPNSGTTRRLWTHLRQHETSVEAMFPVLQTLKEKGQPVPVAAANVLIEVAIHHGSLPQAIDLYKAIPSICVSGANLATFNTLFKMCHRQARKDLALTLAGEMVAMRVVPDALTYDRMMLCCLPHDDYEDGVLYYREMRAKGFEPRFGTALVLVRTLARWGDARVDRVLDELEGMDLPIRMVELRKWVAANFGRRESGVEWTPKKMKNDSKAARKDIAEEAGSVDLKL
jgi:hypothetical protein